MSHQPKKNRKGMSYKLISPEERAKIMELKENGMSCRAIAEKMKKNLKTIQSVSRPDRKQEYRSFKDAVSEFCFDTLMERTDVESMEKNKLRKLILKVVRGVLPPNNQRFAHLIPEQKQDSNKRRIIDQIVDLIIEKIEIYKSDPKSKRINHYSSSTETSLQEQDSESTPEKDTFLIVEDSQESYYEESSPQILSFFSQKSDDKKMIKTPSIYSMDVEFEASSQIYANNGQLFAQNQEMSSIDFIEYLPILISE